MIKISASALKDFVVCKATYQFRRMDGISWPKTPPLIKGSVVHEVIDKVEKGEVKQAEAEDYLQGRILEDLGRGDVEYNQWFKLVDFLNGSKADLNRYFEHKRGTVIESELEFEIPSHTNAGLEFLLVGKIDQITNIGKNRCIVDLKTSRYPPTVFEIQGDYQFTFYALAWSMMRGMGHLPDKIYNFHLGTGKYIEYPRTKDDLDEISSLISEMADFVAYVGENWAEIDKSKGWHCNKCSYRKVCYEVN